MRIIAKLEAQHKIILKTINQIEITIREKPEQIDSKIILPLFDFLTIHLEKHLKLEDEVLYPFLKNHSNLDLQTTGELSWIQMGKLREQFTTFIEKWNIPGEIEKFRSDFITQTKFLIEDLKSRITLEDTDLFPFLEEL